MPETFFTVWNNVHERGRLAAGEWLLVHGGTSGIGTTAIQLAKAFGAKVIATAGSADKCKACLELGADRAVNYKTEDFVAAVKEATGGKGVDVTLDMVGGDYTERNIIAAAEDGRIVQIATLGGADVKLNIARLMMKRLTLTGSTLRPRTREVKAGFARALEAKVWPLLASGKVKVVMDSTFPLAKAADAHRRLETSEHIGKIVLVVEASASEAPISPPSLDRVSAAPSPARRAPLRPPVAVGPGVGALGSQLRCGSDAGLGVGDLRSALAHAGLMPQLGFGLVSSGLADRGAAGFWSSPAGGAPWPGRATAAPRAAAGRPRRTARTRCGRSPWPWRDRGPRDASADERAHGPAETI